MRLCDLELSRELQELGYDGEYEKVHFLDKNATVKVPAPRLDDVAHWIREKHGIHVFLTYIPCSGWWTPYVADMHGNYNSFLAYPKGGRDYEEIYERAVRAAADVIKERQQ